MTPPLTEAEIAELERLESEASSAPWTVELGYGHRHYGQVSCARWDICTVNYDDDRRPCESEDGPAQSAEEDAELIVALRNAAPQLISAARRVAELEREVARQRNFMELVRIRVADLIMEQFSGESSADAWWIVDQAWKRAEGQTASGPDGGGEGGK
jgi:hypothetical protein